MSVATAVKRRLLGTGNILADQLAGVSVAYDPPRDIPRELVYGGSVTGTADPNAMAGGARVKRRQDLTMRIQIRVYRPGEKTTEASDERAEEIHDVIADYLSANWTLGGIDGLKAALPSGFELDGWTDDDGAGSVLTLAVSLLTHLT